MEKLMASVFDYFPIKSRIQGEDRSLKGMSNAIVFRSI